MRVRERVLRVFVDLENVSPSSVFNFLNENKICPTETIVFTKVQAFINEFRLAGITVINSYPRGKNSADFSIVAELIKNLIATQDTYASRYVLTNDKSLAQAFIHQCRTFGVMGESCSISGDEKSYRKSGWVATKAYCEMNLLTPDERVLYRYIKKQSLCGKPVSNRRLRDITQLPIEHFSDALQGLCCKEMIVKLKNNASLVSSNSQVGKNGIDLSQLELRGMAALTEPLTAKQWRQKMGVSRNSFKDMLSNLTIKRMIKRCRKRRYKPVY